MAGPVLLGNRNIQNPNAETSEMLSRAGSLFNEFQKSKRDERDLRMKEDEFNRQQAVNRNVLNYDPQIGIGGRGLSSDTRQAASQYADRVWSDAQQRQAAGEEVDMKSVLGDIQSTLGGLATREDVYDTVYSDALKMGMNAQEAAQFAASRAAGYISRETLRKEEQEYAKAHAERQTTMASSALGVIAKQQADISEHNRLLADDRKARLQAAAQFHKDVTKLRTGGTKSSSKDGDSLEEAEKRMTAKVTAGWPNWDERHVKEAILGFEKYNVDRMSQGLDKLPVAAFETVFNSEISLGTFDDTPKKMDAHDWGKRLNTIFGKESSFGASADAITRYYQKQIENIGAPNYRTTDIPEEFIDKLILNPTVYSPRTFSETEQTRAKEAFYNRFKLFRDGEVTTETPAGNREGLVEPVQTVSPATVSQGTTGSFTTIPAVAGKGLDGAKDTLSAVSTMSGVPVDTLTKFIGLESSFNPDASAEGTTASGYAQINDATWKDLVAKHGKTYGFADADRNDPRVNMLAGALRIRDITESATKSLGREPSEAEVYTMYVMGPTGGLELLKEAASAPDTIAAERFPAAAKSNPALFYNDGKARKSPRTLKELSAVFEQKVAGAGKSFSLDRTTETVDPKKEGVNRNVLIAKTPEEELVFRAQLRNVVEADLLKDKQGDLLKNEIREVADRQKVGVSSDLNIPSKSILSSNLNGYVLGNWYNEPSDPLTSLAKSQGRLDSQIVPSAILDRLAADKATLENKFSSDLAKYEAQKRIERSYRLYPYLQQTEARRDFLRSRSN